MKIYNVFEIYDSFDHGSYESLMGTYDNEKMAIKRAKEVVNESSRSKQYKKDSDSLLWKWVGYDQDSKYIEVREAELNKPTVV